MKTRFSQTRFLAAISALSVVSSGYAADNAANSASATVSVETQPSANVNVAASVRLPYGAADVVKLSRAKVSEEVILTFVQNSGTIYNLNPNDIVYLRDQGVSDRVVTVMLDQRKRAAENNVPAQAPQQPAYADPNAMAATAPYAQPAPVVQAAPSTVYTIPYESSGYSYYGYPSSYYYGSPYYYGSGYGWPYYGGYRSYGYYGPSIGFGFRFGGSSHWGGGHWNSGGHSGGGGGHWNGGGHSGGGGHWGGGGHSSGGHGLAVHSGRR